MNKAVTLTLALILAGSIAWGAADVASAGGSSLDSRDRSLGTLIQEKDVRHPDPLPPTDAEYFYDNGSPGNSMYIGYVDYGYPEYAVKFNPGVGDVVGLRAYVRRLYTYYVEQLIFDVFDDNGGVPGNRLYNTPSWIDIYDAAWYDETPAAPITVEGPYYVGIRTTPYSSYYVWCYWDNDGDQAPAGSQWYYYYYSGWYEDYSYGDLMIRSYFEPQMADDVGVSVITGPAGLFCTCDTLHPKAMVKNFGSADQSDVSVEFVMYDDLGAPKYDEEVTGLFVAANSEVEVLFPDCDPIGYNTVLACSAWTELGSDGRPSNDTMVKQQKVNAFADVAMTYNDGAAENGVAWYAYESNNAVRFPGNCPVQKVMVGIGCYAGNTGDYSCNVQVMLNDGDNGMPGTVIFDSLLDLHGIGYPDWYANFIEIVPPVVVTTDSFYVNWIPHITANPFISVDMTPPIDIGNDWGTAPGSDVWGPFACYYTDAQCDLMIDAFYGGPLHDVAISSIDVPPAVLDSGLSFSPQITVNNPGLLGRPASAVDFSITDTAGVKVFTGSVVTGALAAGASEVITFPDVLTLLPTDYIDSAVITCPVHDYDRSNDTMAQALFVRYLDVLTEIVRPMEYEVPGLVPVTVRLTNKGNVPALVPRLDVTIVPSGYNDHRLAADIGVIAPGEVKDVFLTPWVSMSGANETCTAWITYPEDMFAPSDTDQHVVKTGIPGWAEVAPLPATPSGKPIKDGGCLAYDAGTDAIYGSKGNKTGDFYKFVLPAGTWTNLPPGIPLGSEGKQVSKGSVICADGNGKLYLTKGNNTVGFWGYDANATPPAWRQLTNVPLGSSGKKVKQGAGIAWGTKAGIGYAYLLKGYRNEFHKFDPTAGVNGTWFPLLDAPIGTAGRLKWDAGSWLVADPTPGSHKLYAFKGKYHEMYTYDTEKDSWSGAKSAMPIPGPAGAKKAKDGSCAAWYSGKIYALKGGNTTEFWRYFPIGDTWHVQDMIPLSGSGGSRKKVKGGGALAGYPGTGVYAFKGNKSLEFWRFTPYDMVGAQPNREGVMAGTSEIGSVSFAISPNPLSGGFATIRYSLPKAGLATLHVYDVTGRTVLTQTMAAGRTGTSSLDLRKLEAGVYLAKVTTEGFSTTQKLVVEH